MTATMIISMAWTKRSASTAAAGAVLLYLSFVGPGVVVAQTDVLWLAELVILIGFLVWASGDLARRSQRKRGRTFLALGVISVAGAMALFLLTGFAALILYGIPGMGHGLRG